MCQLNKCCFVRGIVVWVVLLQLGFASFELHMTSPIIYGTDFSNCFTGNTPKYYFNFIHSNLYGIPSLGFSSWNFYLPLGNINTRFSHQGFGNKRYQESVTSMSVKVALNRRFQIWCDIHLFALSIPSYGNAQATGLSLRMRFQATHKVWWGTVFQNINRPVIGKSHDTIPQNIAVLIGIAPVENISTTVAWIQDISLPDYPEITTIKITFVPARWISLTSGYVHNPTQVNVGVRLSFSKLSISYTINYHAEIKRISPFIGLSLGRNF